MKSLALFLLFVICACSTSVEEFSVPVKVDGDIRQLVLAELRASNISLREKGNDCIYVRSEDAESVISKLNQIGQNILPKGLSISFNIDSYESIKDYMKKKRHKV